jgi:hypothetical protein
MALRKADAELVDYVTEGARPTVAEDLARWIEARPGFGTFVVANRDKIRKKLRTATDERTTASVRAELLTAYLLAADRRFQLAFEAYGSGKRGPDLTLTFRSNYRFNVEVTHVGEGMTQAKGAAARLPSLLLGKLRQLPAEIANLLVVALTEASASEADIVDAVRLLKARADHRDDAFFAARGFTTARDFYAHYLRLSGVVLLETTSQAHTVFWLNPEAKHQLPGEAALAVRRCLSG